MKYPIQPALYGVVVSLVIMLAFGIPMKTAISSSTMAGLLTFGLMKMYQRMK